MAGIKIVVLVWDCAWIVRLTFIIILQFGLFGYSKSIVAQVSMQLLEDAGVWSNHKGILCSYGCFTVL